MKFASIGLQAGSRSPLSTEGGEAGFTLLETLTALAILAIALVGLFDAHQRGLRAAAAAENYAQARVLAQSLLADAAGNRVGILRSRQGTEGRFSWSIDVTPMHASFAETKGHWGMRNVHVAVAWGQNSRVELDTLRLRPANE
jgi:prepilin-type N-terminal cleavage/methylation domain-containing protein